MNCEHQCYCRYGVCLKSTGICSSNRCQRGWKGDTCSEGKLHISILFKMTITSIYTQRIELSTPPLIYWIEICYNLNANIYFSKTCVPMKRCNYTGVTLSTISRYNVPEPSLPCIIQNPVCSRFKFGYLNQVCLEKNIYSPRKTCQDPKTTYKVAAWR